MNGLRVSVVINTYNRAKSLGDTLASLKGLDYPDFEVIVVNGPSTDDSEAVIGAWGTGIKALRCPEPNLSMSRNIGIAAAAGDIVAFMDDDAAPHPQWLRELVRPYADDRVGGVGGFTIDNTGVRFQVRKTICDRFGNAHYVSPFFDERPLCVPRTPLYPSLLGTNSSFRRDVLEQIGGFDHTFAYFLDETDVCLRIIDAGHEIHYAPKALIFHQFAESHLRTARRIPKTLYPAVVSKSYFIMRHGAPGRFEEAAHQLEAYRTELTTANKWLCDHSEIGPAHRVSLDQDVAWGIAKGTELGMKLVTRAGGDLGASAAPPAFAPFPASEGLCIAFVSQSFPPANEAGIARWTAMMARGLAARGHQIHVIARASETPSVRFEDGIWVHRVAPEPGEGEIVMAERNLPPNIAEWASAVRRELRGLRTFGLDVVSFPIWDVEGAAIADDTDVGVIMSLHTSYALAKPFKPEWLARPLYRHNMVDKMIRHEAELLERVPVILANSQAIVDDLAAAYGVTFADRTTVALHGTLDPFAAKPERRGMRAARAGGFQIAYVGRFEPRKGIDIAAKAIADVLASRPEATAVFVGDTPTGPSRAVFVEAGAESLLTDPRVTFLGHVTRDGLDDIYATCDVAIMPSRYESFGLVAIEAMAAGAPVIALASGGLKEVVTDGQTGYLVAPGPEAAEACARGLLTLARDPKLRETMGRAARADFEQRFTVEAMVAAAEPAYIKAASMRRQDHVVEPGAGAGRVSADEGLGAV